MTDTQSRRERPLVLVTDDDADLRSLAQLQLGDGFDVIQASNGERCLMVAASEHPDVILLDVMMPGMDGSQVLEKLSGMARTRDIPVIFFSALGGSDHRIKGLEEGAVDYIAKPVESRELVARVGIAARRIASDRELAARNGRSQRAPLPLRPAFEERLGQEVSRSERSAAALSVILIGIDDMATLKESSGAEAVGDVMDELAVTLRSVLRRADGIYRYSDHRFAGILPDTDIATSYLAAERCRQAVAKITVDGRPVAVSIGMAEYSTGRKAEELIAKAEMALLHAQESGGNRLWRADDPRRHSINPIALSGDLTEREWDVLAHLANRRTEQEIAGRMGIRPGTVRSHKARIRRKLHVDPDLRLSEFARSNFKELVNRLEKISAEEQQGEA